MKERGIICLGMFAVMALSNAIVPVLPSFASGSTFQGAIYSAYFLGAFVLTLPAGLMSDRHGRVRVMQLGLVVSVVTGFLLVTSSGPLVITFVRFLEGLGAGLFVAASLAYVNSLADHERMSGYLMASLNSGLIFGLVTGGLLGAYSALPGAGLLIFTFFCLLSLLLSLGLSEQPLPQHDRPVRTIITDILTGYPHLWYSAVVLIGVTGVITSLYPGFSGVTPDTAGVWIAGMSLATIAGVLVFSRVEIPPLRTIRFAAGLMAAGIICSFFTPVGFLVVGALAGTVMIAQMAVLAEKCSHQGVAMGLFSTMSYLGMSILPFLAGIIADITGLFPAFCFTAAAALSVILLFRFPDQQEDRPPASVERG